MKIYELRENYNYSQFFIVGSNYFYNNTLYWHDTLKNETYFYEMRKSSKGVRNFNIDISVQLNHLLLSDRAKPLFEKFGDFFDVHTESKRKKFTGFFPNKCIVSNSVINSKLSDSRIMENENIIYDNVFFNKKIEDIDWDSFVVSDVASTIYISDKMKELLEATGLLGFESRLVYDSDLSLNWKFDLIKDNLDCPNWGRIIREAYNFYGSLDDFESVVPDKELVEEQPFSEIYEQYKNDISSISDSYQYISKYHIKCALSKNLRDVTKKLSSFYSFLNEKGIFLKRRYIGLFPDVKMFADGVMIGGMFAKGLKIEDL